jgi:hypothetical protein
MRHFLTCLLLVAGNAVLFGQTLPANYTLPPTTMSLDQKYGVLVPQAAASDSIKNPANSIIEVATGKVIGAIKADAIFDRSNNDTLKPTRWSADDSQLLWLIDGKWGYDTAVLVTLADGRIKSQVNIISLLQKAILTRAKKASPAQYAKIKAAGAGDGSWFKDGFAVDCVPVDGGTLKFPLDYNVYMGANIKQIDGAPDLEARMTAQLNQDGTIKVTDFHLGDTPPARNW